MRSGTQLLIRRIRGWVGAGSIRPQAVAWGYTRPQLRCSIRMACRGRFLGRPTPTAASQLSLKSRHCVEATFSFDLMACFWIRIGVRKGALISPLRQHGGPMTPDVPVFTVQSHNPSLGGSPSSEERYLSFLNDVLRNWGADARRYSIEKSYPPAVSWVKGEPRMRRLPRVPDGTLLTGLPYRAA